jgi:hypothetical protein
MAGVTPNLPFCLSLSSLDGWIKAVISPFYLRALHLAANSTDSNRPVAAKTGLTELSGAATAKSCLCWNEMESGGAAAAAAPVDGDGRTTGASAP